MWPSRYHVVRMKLAKLNSRNRHAGPKPKAEPLKLDFGCGPNKRQDFKGVDCVAFPGVDFVLNIATDPWPWKDDSVEEAHASHFLEHLTAPERMRFMNELYRVLKPGGKCTIIVPHWASCRAYGDLTHEWPPVSEFFWFYLKRDWRMAQAPHTDAKHMTGGLDCNFDVTWGYSFEPGVAARNQEYQQFAMTYYKEAAQDMISTLIKLT